MIVIRGETFADAEAAAARFGVKPLTIKRAARRGKLDRVGVPAHVGRKPRSGQFPVTVRGKTYPSAKAAAKALRVSPTTIWTALHRGRIDFVGKGRSRAHRVKGGDAGPTAKPVSIGPFRWPSVKSAARDLEVSRATLKAKLARGDVEWLAGKIMAYRARVERKAREERQDAA